MELCYIGKCFVNFLAISHNTITRDDWNECFFLHNKVEIMTFADQRLDSLMVFHCNVNKWYFLIRLRTHVSDVQAVMAIDFDHTSDAIFLQEDVFILHLILIF